MLKLTTALLAVLLVAGCTSMNGSSSGTTAAAAPAASSAENLAGTWTGRLPGGNPVTIRISEDGDVAYTFAGQNVPVTAVKRSGNSLVLTVGSGGGRITLTPSGSRLNYHYRFGGDQASASLSRA